MPFFGIYHGGATSREIFSGFYVVFPEKSQDMTMFVVILHEEEKTSSWKFIENTKRCSAGLCCCIRLIMLKKLLKSRADSSHSTVNHFLGQDDKKNTNRMKQTIIFCTII